MRNAALALISVCALAACNPSAPAGDAGNAADGGLFPNLSNAAYRAEATVSHENGETLPVVMIRDGGRLRMEFNSAEGQMAIVNGGANAQSFVLMTNGGRTMALNAGGMGNQIEDPAESWGGELGQNATRTGSCSVAGESGAEWTKTSEAEGTDTACVTEDGIILRATDDGRVVWETTSVQRGPQDAAQFALPPGVEVMDLGNLGAMADRLRQGQ